jgi:hypothetical protein
MNHVRSSRLLSGFILVLKFTVGLFAETVLLLHFVSSQTSTTDILVTFMIFLTVYECPTFFFKLKQGNNQS